MPTGPMPPLAHAGHGFGQLGISLSTALYGIALLLVVVFLAARAVRPTPTAREPRTITVLTAPASTVVGGGVAALLLLVFLADLVAGVVATGRPLVNPAPWATFVAFIGVQFLSMMVGSAWWPVSPLSTLSRVAGAGAARRAVPAWANNDLLGPVLLALLTWLLVGYHAPFSPRVHGWALLAGTVALVAGAAAWGRPWLRRAEPFAAVSEVAGAVAPFRVEGRRLLLRAPLVGLRRIDRTWRAVGVVVVLGAGAVYEVLSERMLWLEILGTSRGWTRTALETLGIVWVGLVLGAVFEATARVGARLAGDADQRGLRDDVAVAVPLVLGYSLANWFAYLLTEAGQGLIRLASDPFDLRWDLFGTAVRPVDYGILSAGTIAWIEVALVTVGGIGSTLVAHDLHIRRHPARTARRAEWAPFVTVVALTLAGIWSLLGE